MRDWDQKKKQNRNGSACKLGVWDERQFAVGLWELKGKLTSDVTTKSSLAFENFGTSATRRSTAALT